MHLVRLGLVFSVMTFAVACTGRSGEVQANDSALSGSPAGAAQTARRALDGIVGTSFRRTVCGVVVAFEAAPYKTSEGPFRFKSTPCNEEEKDQGNVAGRWSASTDEATDQTLTLTLTPDDNTAPWHYNVERSGAPESAEELPENTPILHGDSAHGRRLFPETFLE